MIKRPPQHRVDAPIVYVHPSDEAWDHARVAKEQAAMAAADPPQDPLQHPFARYHGGWTRYDLDAQATVLGAVVTVRDYLDESKQPTMWTLRRLGWEDWYAIQPAVEKAVRAGERPMLPYLKACIAGVAKVENGPTLTRPGGRLSSDDVSKIYDVSQELPYDLGGAVYQASLPLTEPEGKL